MPFSKLGLSEELLKTLSNQEYLNPYPIQESVIPAVLQKKDVLGVAQTGSGKTMSYVLPILQLIQQRPANRNRFVQVLVLVPTRELAVQVDEVFQLFSFNLPSRIKTMAVFGGVSINPQMIKMQGVDILVATPGRLLDLVTAKAVRLSDVQILVIDEADKMLNLGFEEEMTDILKLLPTLRQNLLFSATLAKEIDHITQMVLHNPVKIEIEPEPQDLDLINQIAYSVEEERKGPLLRYLIKNEEMTQVLVFVSSTHRADSVVSKLKINGIHAEALHSKKSQGARTESLRKFKTGKLGVLVATDLMSRGIDIPFLPVVINYELPRSPKDYIHRIGRTGRAESPGDAISFVSYEDQHHFHIIQKKIRRRIALTETNQLNFKGF